MEIERRPSNSVVPPAVIPWPIVRPAPVRTLVSRGTGNKLALVRVMGYRGGNNQALAIVPPVEQTGAVAWEIEVPAAGTEVAVAAPLVGDPVV